MRSATPWASSALLLLGSLLSGVGVTRADNPIVQTIFSTDPAPMIYNDRVYVFTGRDQDGATGYDMREWHLYSTSDMQNWQDHGVPANLATFSWANANAWAGQTVQRNGKFYFYVPIREKSGAMSIGVGVSDKIEGPYKDALGKPLVSNNEIDPTVYIDTDGQAYLYWGNPNLSYVKLNTDMISYSGGVNKVQLTTAGFGQRNGNAQRPTTFEEGPWLYKRNSTYYMIYAANCCSEDIRYSTGPSATGPWTYRGVIMASAGASFTNHPGMIDYKGKSYFFYHNGALPGGSGYQRSVAVEEFTYNSDGSIPTIRMSTGGPAQGVKTEVASEGGIAVSFINNGDYIKVRGVNFGSAGAKSFSARVSSATSGGKIEVRLGSATGTLAGTCTVAGTGSWTTWATVTCSVSGATGTKDLFLRFTGGNDNLFNFAWWQFSNGSGTSPQPSTTDDVPAPAPTTTAPAPTTTANNPAPNCQALYAQCGGQGWSGATCCSQGTCKVSNEWYSQCL
ncbi:hypothetical protein PG989_003102 [Apiospora arundinis]